MSKRMTVNEMTARALAITEKYKKLAKYDSSKEEYKDAIAIEMLLNYYLHDTFEAYNSK